MNTLPTLMRKNGYQYHEVARDGNLAVYSQTMPGHHSPDYFEVWVIRYRKERILNGTVLPAGERMPFSEEWGSYGFTYGNLADALAKFEELKTLQAINQEQLSTNSNS